MRYLRAMVRRVFVQAPPQAASALWPPTVPVLTRGECLYSCYLPSNNQRLDSIRALVGEHGFNVGMMASDVVLQQNAVGTEHLTRIGYDFAGQARLVHFRQGSHGIDHLARSL